MAATREDVDRWITIAKKKGVKHIISVCDTWDHDDYPVYVMPNDDLEEMKKRYDNVNMQRINEIITINEDGSTKSDLGPELGFVLHWEKVPRTMSKEDWLSISADGAPPGVYRPNMSIEDMLKWKAKLITGDDKRVEIRKTFRNTKTGRNYSSQVLIQVRLNSEKGPDVLISTNGKIALSHSESIMIQLAIEEAKLALSFKAPGKPK